MAAGLDRVAVTSVASAATSTALIAANHARRRLIIANDDANLLHIKLGGGTASTTDYSLSIAQNAHVDLGAFTGAVSGIWATDGTGGARITEIS